MTTKLIAMALMVSLLGMGGVADARTGGSRGGGHHVARHVGHVRHAGRVGRLGRRGHRTHRVYAAHPHRGTPYVARTHRVYRHPRRFNHSYVYNRGVWPNTGYNRYVHRTGVIPSATTLRNNTITVPATVTLPRSAV
jgi:hypothetical protein